MRNFLMDIMERLRDGKTPVKVGEVIQKTGYTVAHDKHADCRMEESGIRSDSMKSAMKAFDQSS